MEHGVTEAVFASRVVTTAVCAFACRQCTRLEANVRVRCPSLLLAVVLASLSVYAATPQVRGVSPASGQVGTQMQVNGSGFGDTQGTSTVAFGYPTPGNPGQFTYATAAVISWSDTQIVAVVPSAATVGPLKVTVGGVSSNTNIYFSVPAPHVNSIFPTSGVPGTQVTVTGWGFQAVQGNNGLYFVSGGFYYRATASNCSGTPIVATVPSGTWTGPGA